MARGININDPYTISYLDNYEYDEMSDARPTGLPGYTPHYTSDYVGLNLPDSIGNGPTVGNDVIAGTLGQIKGANLNGGYGYNIFQVFNTPSIVSGAVPYGDPGTFTINSTGILNSLRNFQEIDFSSALWNLDPEYYGVINDFMMFLIPTTKVDASKLSIKTLGVIGTPDFWFFNDSSPLASFDPLPMFDGRWWGFSNLSANNLVIAKSGVAIPSDSPIPIQPQQDGPSGSVMGLQALRTTATVLDPRNPWEPLSDASGAFKEGGLVKLQVNADQFAFVLPEVVGNGGGFGPFSNLLSDYKALTLTGGGVAVVLNAIDGGPDVARNDKIKIDGSAMTGSLYFENDLRVQETILFPRAGEWSETSLNGSTLAKMDVVWNASSHTQISFDSTGSLFFGGYDPVPDAYDDSDPLNPVGGAEKLIAKGTSVQNQFLLAERQSIANHKVVWFVGTDRNTYLLDAYANIGPVFDAEPLAPTPVSGRHGASVANQNDFVIQLVGVHTVDLYGNIDGGGDR